MGITQKAPMENIATGMNETDRTKVYLFQLNL